MVDTLTTQALMDRTGVSRGYTLQSRAPLFGYHTPLVREVFCADPHDDTELNRLNITSDGRYHTHAFATPQALADSYVREKRRLIEQVIPSRWQALLGRTLTPEAKTWLDTQDNTHIDALLTHVQSLPLTHRVANVLPLDTVFYSIYESGLFDNGILQAYQGRIATIHIEPGHHHDADLALWHTNSHGADPSAYYQGTLLPKELPSGANNVRVFTCLNALMDFLSPRLKAFELKQETGEITHYTL